MANDPSAAFWLRRARAWALLVNLALFWQRLMPPFIVINLLFAAYILIARRSGAVIGAGVPWYLLAIALAAAYALFRLRGKYFTLQDALLRIETAQGLQNRLSCASAGALPWPPPSAYRGSVVRLRPHIAVLPLLYSAAFILAGLWFPLGKADKPSLTAASTPPSAWAQVEDWAQLLKEEQVVSPEAAETLQERLNELRQRPQEEWYSQGSLEAGEALREETRLAMQELARQMQATNALLTQMAGGENALMQRAGQAEQIEQAWQQQLQQMQASQLAVNPELMAQLQSLDFSQISQMSPEQMQAMQERMAQGIEKLGAASGLNAMELEAITIRVQQQAGSGEVERGPGAAPLIMAEQGTDLMPGTQQPVSNQDMRNAALGDTVAVSSRPAGEDQQQGTSFAPGTPTSSEAQLGSGGNIVWRESYTPQERAVLEQFFQ